MSTIKTECAAHLKAIAQRCANAEANFIETLSRLGEISKADAKTLFDTYRALGLVKLDSAIGRYSVTHGSFLDRETIRRMLRNLQD